MANWLFFFFIKSKKLFYFLTYSSSELRSNCLTTDWWKVSHNNLTVRGHCRSTPVYKRWALTRPNLSILLTRSKYEADRALTRVLFDPTWWDFFLTRGAKNWKIGIFRGKFLNPNAYQRWLTRPNPSNKNLIRPRSKFFYPDPSLQCLHLCLTDLKRPLCWSMVPGNISVDNQQGLS